jgi:hypothetical protein
MLRKFPVLPLLMAAMICSVGMAKNASATVTFSIVWTSTTGTGITGSNSIFADPGDVIQLSLIMTTDQTLAAHGVSINYDTDLGNELNFLAGKEWLGTSFGTTTMAGTYASLVAGLGPPAPVESTNAVAGRINTYESGKTPAGAFLPTGSYAVGTARFVVNPGASTDGDDLFLGLFSVGIDDVINNLNGVIPSSGLVFGTAAVNVIPEPGTATLLGLGLVGLVMAGRRARR